MNKMQIFFKRYTPTILTYIGSIGVIGTSVLAVKATPKALKLIEEAEEEKGDKLTVPEAIETAWKPYIPTFLMGFSTIGCILGANLLNAKSQAALMSAYGMLNQSYQEYIDKTKELYGEEADERIKSEIAKDHMFEYTENSKKSLNPTNNTQLFMDFQSMRYFESSIEKILKAEQDFNQEFAANGVVTLNDWYDIIGIGRTSYGNDVGWCDNGKFFEIPFEHERVTIDDDLELFIISFDIQPTQSFYADA